MIKICRSENDLLELTEAINAIIPSELVIYLDCGGGDRSASEMLSIALKATYSATRNDPDYKTWDYHFVVFTAHSAACNMLLYLPKEKIYAHVDATFMFHKGKLRPSDSAIDIDSIEREAKYFRQQDENIFARIKEKLPEDYWKRFEAGEDVYFNAQQALEWGIISEIVE